MGVGHRLQARFRNLRPLRNKSTTSSATAATRSASSSTLTSSTSSSSLAAAKTKTQSAPWRQVVVVPRRDDEDALTSSTQSIDWPAPKKSALKKSSSSRRSQRVVFQESANVSYENDKYWEQYVPDSCYHPIKLKRIKEGVYRYAQEVARSDQEQGGPYATVLQELYQGRTDEDSSKVETLRTALQTILRQEQQENPSENPNTRIGLEQLIVPWLEQEMTKRRTERTKLVQSIAKDDDETSSVLEGEELAQKCIQNSQPARAFATEMALALRETILVEN